MSTRIKWLHCCFVWVQCDCLGNYWVCLPDFGRTQAQATLEDLDLFWTFWFAKHLPWALLEMEVGVPVNLLPPDIVGPKMICDTQTNIESSHENSHSVCYAIPCWMLATLVISLWKKTKRCPRLMCRWQSSHVFAIEVWPSLGKESEDERGSPQMLHLSTSTDPGDPVGPVGPGDSGCGYAGYVWICGESSGIQRWLSDIFRLFQKVHRCP